MTVTEFIDSLPHHRRLSAEERMQLAIGLWFNSATDAHGVALIAYMPDTARKMLKLLKIAGWYETPQAREPAG